MKAFRSRPLDVPARTRSRLLTPWSSKPGGQRVSPVTLLANAFGVGRATAYRYLACASVDSKSLTSDSTLTEN